MLHEFTNANACLSMALAGLIDDGIRVIKYHVGKMLSSEMYSLACTVLKVSCLLLSRLEPVTSLYISNIVPSRASKCHQCST